LPENRYDYLVPAFIVTYLPHGVIGLILVGIFASAMSSIDSAINSLSAATLKDILMGPRRFRSLISQKFIFYSRLTTLLWGALCTSFAFLVGNVSSTVIEGINKIGSVFYGPILAVFALGILASSANSTGVIAGLFMGTSLNVVLWIFAQDVSWLWWNVTGFLCAFTVGIFVGIISNTGRRRITDSLTFDFSGGWRRRLVRDRGDGQAYFTLAIYFCLIVLFSWGLNKLLD
jgi:SSS family solute:Na+ symporter